MKFTRKLIPALAMLVVSATMMSTASFAWFSMNRTVTATGMQATAVAPVNLLISATGANASDFANQASTTKTVSGKLAPMSITKDSLVDLNGFVLADGTIIGANGIGGTVGTDVGQIDTDYVFETGAEKIKQVATTDGQYIDYTFYVKLSQAVEGTTEIYLSSLTIEETTGMELAKAARVAVINGSTVVGIYGVDANDALDDKAALAVSAYTPDPDEDPATKAKVTLVKTPTVVTTTATKTNDTYKSTYASNAVGASLVAVTDTAVTLTVRVWIEGQDTDCINVNAAAELNVSVEFSVK